MKRYVVSLIPSSAILLASMLTVAGAAEPSVVAQKGQVVSSANPQQQQPQQKPQQQQPWSPAPTTSSQSAAPQNSTSISITSMPSKIGAPAQAAPAQAVSNSVPQSAAISKSVPISPAQNTAQVAITSAPSSWALQMEKERMARNDATPIVLAPQAAAHQQASAANTTPQQAPMNTVPVSNTPMNSVPEKNAPEQVHRLLGGGGAMVRGGKTLPQDSLSQTQDQHVQDSQQAPQGQASQMPSPFVSQQQPSQGVGQGMSMGSMNAEKPAVQEPVWHVAENAELEDILRDWAHAAGWKVVWHSEYSYVTQASTSFQGSFVQAAAALFGAMVGVEPKLYETFYRGNKVLVVSNNPQK